MKILQSIESSVPFYFTATITPRSVISGFSIAFGNTGTNNEFSTGIVFSGRNGFVFDQSGNFFGGYYSGRQLEIEGHIFNEKSSEVEGYISNERLSYFYNGNLINNNISINENNEFSYGYNCFEFDKIEDSVISLQVNYVASDLNITIITNLDLSVERYEIIEIPENWQAFNTNIDKVQIGNIVTSIGQYAFRNCTSLTSIIIPNSVMSIGSYAFLECNSLTSIQFPSKVTVIPGFVCSGCNSLKSVVISENVTEIKYFAFSSCFSLESFIIPDSVTKIEDGAFSYCTSLTSITIPSGVTVIAQDIFQSCTSLTSIVIPENVTQIGDKAFINCSSLTSITILANTAPTLGSLVFSNIPATEVRVPIGAIGYGTTYGGLTVVYGIEEGLQDNSGNYLVSSDNYYILPKI